MFEHTAKETGMWRGWLKNGESLEINWPNTSVGFRIYAESNDADRESFRAYLGLGLVNIYAPLWLSSKQAEYGVFDGPSWGFDMSKEFGFTLTWGHRRKNFNWPFYTYTKEYEYLDNSDTWRDVSKLRYDEEPASLTAPKSGIHQYHYTLKSGEVQVRVATVSKRRHILSRHILGRLGWPDRIHESIEVRFNEEVGERTGSWKGGAVGCGYDMKPGELPVDTLRRMEKERMFR